MPWPNARWSGSDLVSATNPENGTVTYQYDGAHHVTLRTDAKGQQTVYSYDAYGRLTKKQYWAWFSNYGGTQVLQEQTDQEVDYYYDTNPIDAKSVEMGQLTWYIDSSKAEKELGWIPRDPMDTLQATVDDLGG